MHNKHDTGGSSRRTSNGRRSGGLRQPALCRVGALSGFELRGTVEAARKVTHGFDS